MQAFACGERLREGGLTGIGRPGRVIDGSSDSGHTRARKIVSEEKRTKPLALRRIKVYLKLTLIVAVVVIGLLVIAKNRDHETDVWFFRMYEDVNVVHLMLITAVVSVVVWWGLVRLTGLWREIRELRRQERLNSELAAHKRLAQEIADREKRIDEKVRQAIRDNG